MINGSRLMVLDNQKAFLELVRAGLWEKESRLLSFGKVDYEDVLRLAENQSVVGLVAAGLEHVVDVKVPKEDVLQFVGQALQLEQQNQAMNLFIGVLVDKLRKKDVYTLLVKGQGVAQCYEKPLWRACGDVDLYLSDSNYQKAKEYLTTLASEVDNEDKKNQHLGMNIDPWVVELHGTMHTELSKRINEGLDDVHESIFYGGEVRSWNNDGISVFLPSADNDVIIVFTHFLQHFFIEGVGLRQICDWSRLLWTYRSSIDMNLLEKRIRKMGLMSEWKAFASLVVNTLGMPEKAMPFYSKGYENRAGRILSHIMKTGNMGHNNDVSYRTKYKGIMSGVITLYRRMCDFMKFTFLFPVDSPKFFVKYVIGKV